MFATSLLSAVVLALSATSLAKPVPSNVVVESSGGFSPNLGTPTSLNSVSFNGWGGFSCLDNFDNFFGQDNFCGQNNVQTVEEQTVVCQQESVTFIQQRLAVIEEFAKRIITEQICEVEVQTVVWSQWISQFQLFSEDIRHISGRHIGFDSSIASNINGLVDSSNHINSHNLNFQGSDIGQNFLSVGGNNWVEGSSQLSVEKAFLASQVDVLQSSSSSSSNFNQVEQSLGRV
jgi:hypothetical protein